MASAKARAKITIDSTVQLELTLDEAKALNEMTKYGITAFLTGYEKMLGKHYIAPHKEGLTSLFKTIDNTLPETINTLIEINRQVAEMMHKQKS